MTLELDIPENDYREEGIEPAILSTLYSSNQNSSPIDEIRVLISFCPLFGRTST